MCNLTLFFIFTDGSFNSTIAEVSRFLVMSNSTGPLSSGEVCRNLISQMLHVENLQIS